MKKSEKNRVLTRLLHLLCSFSVVLCTVSKSEAERLPLRFYTSADGMASSVVQHVFRDSADFLWFSTREGLTRFDGRDFVNYKLPTANQNRNVAFVFETRGGVYLIGGSDGLYRLQRQNESTAAPESEPKSKNDSVLLLNAEKVSDDVYKILYEDRDGRIWAGSSEGLNLLEEVGGELLSRKVELPEGAFTNYQLVGVTSICEGRDGSLWVGGQTGISRRLPGGLMLHYPIERVSDYDSVLSIAEDNTGNLFVGHSAGLFVFHPETPELFKNNEPVESRRLSVSQKVIDESGKIPPPAGPGAMVHMILRRSPKSENEGQYNQVSKVFRASDGKIWATSNGVLYEFEAGTVRSLDDERGLPINFLGITEDADGNLWFGTTSGAIRLANQGFTTLGRTDGLFPLNIQSLHQTSDGKLFAVFGDWRVAEITPYELKTTRLKMPDAARSIWGSTVAMPDGETGGWWALSEDGLYYFASLQAPPAKIYGKKDGLKSDSLFCSYQDKNGNFWFSTRRSAEEAGLSRFNKRTNRFQTFSAADNFPEGKSPMSFAEDSQGNLWIGFYQGGIARFANNLFENFDETENAPAGMVPRLHVDGKGRLWIASSRGGLSVVENPGAEKPVFKKITVAQGLAISSINTVDEDVLGNIYVGTSRGIDRLTPDSGEIRHFSTADGLAADLIHLALKDRSGLLWFGTPNGLSRLRPQPEKPRDAPTILISDLQIAGRRYGVSELGQSRIENISVPASENNLQISFLSVGDAANLFYQHRLEGAGEHWSEPTLERSVNFANLAPGSYRFIVRAVNNHGTASERPALISFSIRPPFWRTWEFIVAAVLVVGAGVFTLDRYRVAKTRQVQTALEALRKSKEERLVELERVRNRIATDLHDDVGASLTQITVLTEVARRQAGNNQNQLDAALAKVSGVATELMAAMGDIVWAINPRKDNLRDLVQRMRRFASDIFTAQEIKFDFDAPDVEINTPMGANLRRELYVIFKEAVNNIARHSEATRAEISLAVFADCITLKVSDNGKGFNLEEKLCESFSPETGGNGLINLRRRGAELGGRCELISFANGGTTVLLEIPLQSDEFTSRLGSENCESNQLQ